MSSGGNFDVSDDVKNLPQLNNLRNSLITCFERLGDLADLDGAIQVLQQTVSLTPDGHLEKPSRLDNLADSLLTRFERRGELADLDGAIQAHKQAVSLTPDDHPDNPSRLNNLGNSLLTRFECRGELTDLDRAIEIHKQAVTLTPNGHPDKPSRLNNVGNSLRTHFKRLGELGDLNEAIDFSQMAVSLTPDGHPDKPSWLNNLGNSLLTRFERLGELADLDGAIQAHKQAVSLTPDGHPDNPRQLGNLGSSLLTRFKHLGGLEDLHKGIQYHQQAISLTPDGHPKKPSELNNLGISLLTRFERLGELADIDGAIQIHKQAVSLTPDGHPDKPSWLNSLGNSLLTRFERLGELADLDGAIQAHKEAVSLTPDSHPDRPSGLNNLGISLLKHFERLGELEDLDGAIQAHKQAVSLTPDGHPDNPRQLGNLGSSLLTRFEYLGELADLDEAIQIHQQAISLTPDDHPKKPSRLNNLGNSLLTRFERLGELADLGGGIQVYQQAISLTPDDHPDKPSWLNNLGNSLRKHFERLGDLADLDGAIQAQKEAISLTPDDHPDKPSELTNLGISLHTRFECLAELTDIDRAIQAHKQAVSLIPDDHPDRPSRLSNLGNSFHKRFEQLGELGDLEGGIQIHQQAVSLTPDGHPDKPGLLRNLGISLYSQFQHSKDMEALDKTIQAFAASAKSLSEKPLFKFNTAEHWTWLLHLKASFSSLPADKNDLLDAYKTLFNLLMEIASLGSSIRKRFEDIGDAASDAISMGVAAAIKMQEYYLAVEWMEQGRSIVWGQLLQLRSPLNELRDIHPKMAADLERLSQHLEAASFRISQPGQAIDSILEREAQDHRRAAEKRQELLKEIRLQPGFETFLKPTPFSTLSQATHTAGLIVLINVSILRGDALVLSACNPIAHIPLPDISIEKVKGLHSRLISILDEGHVRLNKRDFGRKPHFAPSPEQSELGSVLADLWNLIVHPILKKIEDVLWDAATTQLPRITWCPTGLLSFLPLHAAGIYGSPDEEGTITINDFAVSSYAPTLSILLPPKTEIPASGPPRILAISELSTLPGAKKEAVAIKKLAERHQSEIENFSGTRATTRKVLESIGAYNWVHLACHGIQDTADPLSSGFVLHDGRLHLESLMKISIDKAQLAFLSACQTATGDQKLPDESIHLTSGMLAAGFSSVVGTLWSIEDQDAPVVAEEFYEHLFKAGSESGWSKRPDAAYALHEAVKKLREEVGVQNLLKWVPFVHFGV